MQPAVQIRPALPQDAATLIALDDHAQRANERVDEILAAIVAGQCWCALRREEIVGYRIDSHGFFGRPFLELVVVKPSARQTGVAGRLVQDFRQRHRDAVYAACKASHLPSQRLLTASGFRVSGYLDGLEVGDPVIVYRAAALTEGTHEQAVPQGQLHSV